MNVWPHPDTDHTTALGRLVGERLKDGAVTEHVLAAPDWAGLQLEQTQEQKLGTLLDLCVSSLRRGHANLLCIVPILSDDPRRESNSPATPVSAHALSGWTLVPTLFWPCLWLRSLARKWP